MDLCLLGIELLSSWIQEIFALVSCRRIASCSALLVFSEICMPLMLKDNILIDEESLGVVVEGVIVWVCVVLVSVFE